MEQAQREYFVRRLNEIAAEKIQSKAQELFVGSPLWPTTSFYNFFHSSNDSFTALGSPASFSCSY